MPQESRTLAYKSMPESNSVIDTSAWESPHGLGKAENGLVLGISAPFSDINDAATTQNDHEMTEIRRMMKESG